MLWWVEEDGELMLANKPTALAPLVIATEQECLVKGYCQPLTAAELSKIELAAKGDDLASFLLSPNGKRVLKELVDPDEFAW